MSRWLRLICVPAETIIFCLVGMFKNEGTETSTEGDTLFPSFVYVSLLDARLVPLTIYSKCCRKQTLVLIPTSILLISDRNLYTQVPHFSKVKVSTRLINDRDWWRRHFCSYWKKASAHKYLILQTVLPLNQNLWWSILFLALLRQTLQCSSDHRLTLCVPGIQQCWNHVFMISKSSCRWQSNSNSEEGMLN